MDLLLFWKWLQVGPYHPFIHSLTKVSCTTLSTHHQEYGPISWAIEDLRGRLKEVVMDGLWCTDPFWFVKASKVKASRSGRTESNYKPRVQSTNRATFQCSAICRLVMDWRWSWVKCNPGNERMSVFGEHNLNIDQRLLIWGWMESCPHQHIDKNVSENTFNTPSALNSTAQPHRTSNSPCSRELIYSGERRKYWQLHPQMEERISTFTLSNGR